MGDVIIGAVIMITSNYQADVPSVSGASVSDGDNLGLLVTGPIKYIMTSPPPRPPGVPVWDPPTSAGLLSSRLVAAVWTSPVAAAAVWWQLLARHCDSQDIWSRGWGQHQAPAPTPDSHWACWPPWWWWGWSHLQWLCYNQTKRWKWFVNINGFRYNFGLLLFHLSYGWIGNG